MTSLEPVTNNDTIEVPELKDEELEKGLLAVASSPSKFCTALLDFTPFPYQMELLEDPSKNIVVCAARQVGKSKIIGARALWFAFTRAGTSTYIVAATQRQSMMMFDSILSSIEGNELIMESVVRKTRTQLHFTNGSKIVALPCGRKGKTLRGATAHFVIVDESAFVPEEVILEVLLPMLSTTDGTIILMSTPLDRSHFFYKAFNSPMWSKYHFQTADNPLVTQEFLNRQREFLEERGFAQEHLAEFVDEEGTYF
ncbi:MAG: terminase large subunit domain-containing protein, partial [Nitrososphaerales archaeon]